MRKYTKGDMSYLLSIVKSVHQHKQSWLYFMSNDQILLDISHLWTHRRMRSINVKLRFDISVINRRNYAPMKSKFDILSCLKLTLVWWLLQTNVLTYWTVLVRGITINTANFVSSRNSSCNINPPSLISATPSSRRFDNDIDYIYLYSRFTVQIVHTIIYWY